MPAQRLRFCVSRERALADIRQGANHALPRIEVLGQLALGAKVLGRVQLWLDRRHDPFGDFVLQCKDVGKLTIVTLGPDMISASRLNELGADADAVASPAHTAFE